MGARGRARGARDAACRRVSAGRRDRGRVLAVVAVPLLQPRIPIPIPILLLLLLLHAAARSWHHGTQQDVFRLDIPVDDPQRVQVRHGVEARRHHLARDRRLLQLPAGPLEGLVEVPAGSILLHQVDVVLVLEGREQVDDVRVGQPRVEADLARHLVPVELREARLPVELERDARARAPAGRRVEQRGLALVELPVEVVVLQLPGRAVLSAEAGEHGGGAARGDDEGARRGVRGAREEDCRVGRDDIGRGLGLDDGGSRSSSRRRRRRRCLACLSRKARRGVELEGAHGGIRRFWGSRRRGSERKWYPRSKKRLASEPRGGCRCRGRRLRLPLLLFKRKPFRKSKEKDSLV